jgi:hypothetical protein
MTHKPYPVNLCADLSALCGKGVGFDPNPQAAR